MSKKIFWFGILFLPILFLRAEEVSNKPVGNEQTHVTIPWQEFKNILHLDEKEIVLSLETFQKLLTQTGVKSVPSQILLFLSIAIPFSQSGAFENGILRLTSRSCFDLIAAFRAKTSASSSELLASLFAP